MPSHACSVVGRFAIAGDTHRVPTSAAGFTRDENGRPTGFPHAARLAAGLELPVASLTRGFTW